ncbi:HEAT repeat domain-containing protein [Neochlamydia sp. AcF65]|uniref:HEAT repeat domain-containing protein n=1 Tax=Neochlamydia sp. AcF65 TaxID=2795735 RepID=UPI001BC95703|nr:HEAT repeat domain-containing protein [Neochlamydia sp. AcF65]
MQTKPGLFNVQAVGRGIHLEQNATLLIHSNPIIQYHPLQPLSQATLNPQSLSNSLRSLYFSQKTLSIFRIKVEQEWEFKVHLEEIYVRLGIIESKERIKRDQALDKHSDYLQDGCIPTFETIYKLKKNIEIEHLFKHESFKNKSAKRTYIQGAAGIGKSTLCHYIAYRWAKEELWQSLFSYLFWIPLRNLTLRKYPADKEYTPADLIAREYAGKIDSRAIEACINDATLREKTLLVLDGYDELSAEAQGNTSLATAFKELKELFPHILITSRPGSCSFNRSCELELLGFDKEGVERYIDKFFKQVQAEEKKQKLYHLLQSSPQVLSLAQIPINLTLLCCLFNEDPEVFDSDQSITMTAIYERIVNWMYKWFLFRRIDQGHSNQTKEKILAEKNLRRNQEVAKIAKAFEEMADFAMKKNTLYLEENEIDHFRGKAITSNELTDCGLIRIPEEKGYFIHLTFQEFLTASKIANQYLRGKNRQACQDFMRNYKFEPRYSLVLRMIAGYLSLSTSRNRLYLDLNPLQSFFDDLFAEPHDLAIRSELNLIAECFEECQKPAQVRQYEGFIELVKDCITHLSSLDLNFEGLLRNKNLFNHPKITCTIETFLSQPNTIENMLKILLKITSTGQWLPAEIVRLILKIIDDPDKEEDDDVRRCATYVLGDVIRQGGEIAKEMLDILIQLLKEGDSNIISSAAYVLAQVAEQGGEIGSEALDALIQILKENDFKAKYYAAYPLRAAAKQGGEFPKEALDALIQILKEGNSYAKRYAVDVLRELLEQGAKIPKEALDALIQILKKDNPRSKRYAAYVLKAAAEQEAKLPKEAIDALIQILKESDSNAKSCAADALAIIAKQGAKLPKEALDALIQILKESDSNAKSCAANALAFITKQGSEVLDGMLHTHIQILKENDAKAQHSAADVLRELLEQEVKLPKAALDALIQILKENPSNAKRYAADVLKAAAEQGAKLPEEAPDVLIQILKEGDLDTIRSATHTLVVVAKQGGGFLKKAFDALIQILKENDSYAKGHVAYVLGEVAEQGAKLPEEALDALIQILKESDSNAKSCAANALAIIAKQGAKLPEEALDALIQILTESDPEAKGYATYVLKAVAEQGAKLPEEALDALIQILKESDPEAKGYAACVLKAVAEQGAKLPKEALDALIQILKESDSNDKECAVVALGAMVKQGVRLPEKAIDVLIQILKGNNFIIKDHTAYVLGAVAKQGGKLPKEALDALIQILKEGWEFNDGYAAYALGAIVEQGNEIANKALEALIQIFEEGDPYAKMPAIEVLKKVDKNALLKKRIKGLTLIAKICFFTGNSLSVKGQILQISDKRIACFSKRKLKLTYDELIKKLPEELALWRKRLDSFSQTKIYK